MSSLIKALVTAIIGGRTPNRILSDCVICSSSVLKERELSALGKIPCYGASGVSGYTDTALCESDSILITKDGSGVGSLRYVKGKHAFVGTLCSLTEKPGSYLPYVYYALRNVSFDSYRTGQAIPHVYFKDYGRTSFYCPEYNEQKRIAHGMELLDSKVSFEKRLLSFLEKTKTYLLARMFI